jgi:hypothetical protein
LVPFPVQTTARIAACHHVPVIGPFSAIIDPAGTSPYIR